MRTTTALCFGILVLASMASADLTKFTKFMKDFRKTYDSAEEFGMRYQTFVAKLAQIEKLNKANPLATFGINKFADRTEEEMKALRGYSPSNLRRNIPHAAPAPKATESSVDWRQKGAVTPVKNQEQCGSCWAFSATEEIESMWFMAGNNIPTLAPQQMVSCDYNSDGCNGGNPPNAYQYIQSAGGIDTESAYPYTSGNGVTGQCQVKKSGFYPGLKVTGFEYAGQYDENEMMSQLAAKGPISICLAASTWDSYQGGILTQCSNQVDHCVQLVGYNSGAPKPYWIVRNSWGTDWGESGYIMVEMGKNLCQIQSEPTIVNVA